MVEDFPQDFDHELLELDGQREESYDEEEEGDTVDGGMPAQDGDSSQPEVLNNELSELAGLDGSVAMGDDSAQKEYVEPSQHDMRRSRQVNADMAKKLEKEEEERKNAPKRPSRGDFKNR